MAAEVHTQILGVDTILDAKEDELEFKKIQEEFENGLGTVFAEVKDVELRTNAEISKMTPEEFFLELKKLDDQYDGKIKKILSKQVATEKEIIKLEEKRELEAKEALAKQQTEKKIELDHLERIKEQQRQIRIVQKESNISKFKNQIKSLELDLKKLPFDSLDFDTAVIALEKARKGLQIAESINID